jgi:hypothetical protein
MEVVGGGYHRCSDRSRRVVLIQVKPALVVSSSLPPRGPQGGAIWRSLQTIRDRDGYFVKALRALQLPCQARYSRAMLWRCR